MKRVKTFALEITKQGAAAWELKSTLRDIDETIASMNESNTKNQLAKVREQLFKLIIVCKANTNILRLE